MSPATACGVCSGPVRRRWAAREMMLGLRHPFTYGACDRCGAVQLLDPPADMSPYYGEGYYSFGGDLDAEFADPDVRGARGAAVRALLELPAAEAEAAPMPDTRRPLLSLRGLGLTPQSRILDVGCGSGRLLYLLALAGFERLLGADAFLPADRTYAGGLTVRRAELDALEGGWDLIMLHHAFEHLAAPQAVLRAAAARLAPGGRVLLRLPVADSFAWRRYRADWVQLDAPRHLYLHTRRSLARLARAAGLEVEAVACDSYELQFWGSEQYRRGIPLNDPAGWRFGAGAPIFTPRQIARWKRASAWLNRIGQGDQAVVRLRARA